MRKLLKYCAVLALALSIGGAAKASSTPADFNGDCQLDQTDINGFVQAFRSQDSAADINNDGMWDMRDLVVFINSYRTASADSSNICPAVIPVLQPGDGWDGPTVLPPTGDDSAMAGDSLPGHDAKVIARWDVVPYQTFGNKLTHDSDTSEEIFEIGVVAFHMNGIDRVEFSVEGGPWESVNEMVLNPRTKVWEYTVAVDASLFDENGQVEIRSIAYPKNAGIPRVLDSLHLKRDIRDPLQVYVGSFPGVDSTFDTLPDAVEFAKSQGDRDTEIILASGQYEFGHIQDDGIDRYIVVKAGEGEDATLTGYNRPKLRFLKFEGLKFLLHDRTIFEGYTDDVVRHLWLDNSYIYASDRAATQRSISGRWRVFATGSMWENVANGPGGYLIRDVVVKDILSDAFSGAQMVINSVVESIDRLDTAAHPDVYQVHNTVDNAILYGLVSKEDSKAQGIFVAGNDYASNFAVVNSVINIDGYQNQWSLPGEHILFFNNVITDTFTFRTTELHNFVMRQNIFDYIRHYQAEGVEQNIIAEDNHVIQPDRYNSLQILNDTVGYEGIVEDPDVYWRAEENGPLYQSVPRLTAGDLNGLQRSDLTSVGAVE